MDRILPLALYCGGVAAFLLAVFWRPQVGLYYLIWLLPLQTLRYKMHPFPLGTLFVFWILLGVFLGLLRQRQNPVPRLPLNLLLAAFVLYNYISLWRGSFYLGSPMPLSLDDARTSDWVNYMVLPLLYFAVVAVVRDRRQIAIVLGLMFFATLLVDKSVFSTVRHRDFSEFSYNLRYSGALGWVNANGMGAFEAQVCGFLLAWTAFEKRKMIKLACTGLLLFSAYCLMVSFSRGGYVALLLGALWIGVLKRRSVLVLLALFLITWQAVVPNAVRERILMTYEQGEGLEHSSATRLSLWDNAWQVFQQDPLFGTGIFTFRYVGGVENLTDTHNIYIKVLAETGVLGLAMFTVLLGRMYLLGYRLFRRARDPFLAGLGLSFGAWMVCVAVANIFGDRWTYLQLSGFTWTLLACVVRGHKLLAESGTPSQQNQDAAEETDAPHYVLASEGG